MIMVKVDHKKNKMDGAIQQFYADREAKVWGKLEAFFNAD